MMRKLFFVAMAVVAAPLYSQDVKMPINLDKLAAHAKETVNVTLDPSTLQLASKFLSENDRDEAQVKKIVSKLKHIYVRSFEFDKNGEYSKSDIDSIRAQLSGPAWTRIVQVNSSNGENSEVYVKKNGEQVGGLVVIAAEPKELTIVHIDGQINPDELSELGGHMGIPKIDSGKPNQKNGTSKSKDEE